MKMLDATELRHFGNNKTLGIIGDKNFPFKAGTRTHASKREALGKVKTILKQLAPKLVYLIPHRGFEESIIPLLSYMDIPYVIVNPYVGYFDDVKKSTRIKLWVALEGSKSVVTIGDKVKNIMEHDDTLEESINFILDRSDVMLCVCGPKKSGHIHRVYDKLFERDKVIILNYDGSPDE